MTDAADATDAADTAAQTFFLLSIVPAGAINWKLLPHSASCVGVLGLYDPISGSISLSGQGPSLPSGAVPHDVLVFNNQVVTEDARNHIVKYGYWCSPVFEARGLQRLSALLTSSSSDVDVEYRDLWVQMGLSLSPTTTSPTSTSMASQKHMVMFTSLHFGCDDMGRKDALLGSLMTLEGYVKMVPELGFIPRGRIGLVFDNFAHANAAYCMLHEILNEMIRLSGDDASLGGIALNFRNVSQVLFEPEVFLDAPQPWVIYDHDQ